MINAERITEILKDCFFKQEELPAEGQPKDFVKVDGILGSMGFHPGRLASYKEELKRLIDELPKEFTDGGGWTFLNLCNDRHGNQWTGFHQIMEQLLVLCIGNGLARYSLPREVWESLPGGMPYVQFSKEGFAEKEPAKLG